MSIEHYHQAKNITLLSGGVNLLLATAKTIGGIIYQSHALIADGIHSIFDLLIDGMVLFAVKFGYQSADDEHPYGHQRIETAATLILALILILTGLGIAYSSIITFIHPPKLHPTWEALIITSAILIINEVLFHKTYKVADNIQSSLIYANAWHRRSDTFASLVVLIAISGSLLGVPYLDSLAALLMGLMIIKMGGEYGWNSVKELIDTAADPQLIQDIKKHISHSPGVKKLHQLRSRAMGRDIYIDVHILVQPDISVSEGHYIGVQVHYSLMHKFPNIKDVTVHIDPEDDEIYTPSLTLAHRTTINKQLLNPLSAHLGKPINSNLHYLNGQIILDLYLQQSLTDKDLQQLISKDIAHQLNIKHIRCFKMHGEWQII